MTQKLKFFRFFIKKSFCLVLLLALFGSSSLTLDLKNPKKFFFVTFSPTYHQIIQKGIDTQLVFRVNYFLFFLEESLILEVMVRVWTLIPKLSVYVIHITYVNVDFPPFRMHSLPLWFMQLFLLDLFNALKWSTTYEMSAFA